MEEKTMQHPSSETGTPESSKLNKENGTSASEERLEGNPGGKYPGAEFPEAEFSNTDLPDPGEENGLENAGAEPGRRQESGAAALQGTELPGRESLPAEGEHRAGRAAAEGGSSAGTAADGRAEAPGKPAEETGEQQAPFKGSAGNGSSARDGERTAQSTGGDHTEPEADSSPAVQGTAERELENTLDRVLTEPAQKVKKPRADSYREMIRRHQRRIYRRTVITVILLMLVIMAAVLFWMDRGYTRAELKRVAVLSSEDGTGYENLGGNVVQYGSSGAKCIDQRGNTLWSVSYEMQQPVTSVSGNVIAIANRSGYYVYVMNTQGLMGTIHTMLPIHSIAAAENGEVAVIMNDNKATWVRLYTAQGKEIAYIIRTMEENGYPVAAAVSPDGETLCLSTIQMSNAAVKSNISFYNFGKKGRNAADHRVDSSDYIDEVIPELRYIDNASCVGVSDKSLLLFNKGLFRKSDNNNIVLFTENLQGAFFSESFMGLLFNDTAGDSQYRLDLYNKRGKIAGKVYFSLQYSDIIIAGDKVYIYNDHHCQIYTLGGRCLFNGTFSKSIRALVPGARLSDLLAVTGGEVNLVRFH